MGRIFLGKPLHWGLIVLLIAIGWVIGDLRLHVIGIGAAPNRYLMRKMARFGRGLCRLIDDPRSVDNEIDAFFANPRGPAAAQHHEQCRHVRR